MKIGIVDDERPARSELKYLLQLKIPEAELFEANSSEKMLELLQMEQLDVVFVDIQLGDMNGTTLASLILDQQPDIAIVFATAYEEYALKAFEIGAVDYLLKPFDLDRIDKCINRIAAFRTSRQASNKHEFEPLDNKEKTTLLLSDSIKIIEIKDIIYIQSYNRGCQIYTANEVFYQNQTLNYYDERLRSHQFFRVHKSFLVNLGDIHELIPSYNNGYAIRLRKLKDVILPIGRHQYRELREYFEL